VAAATSLKTEEKPPPDASTAAATSSSGMDSACTGEPLLAAMACRTCNKKAVALSSNTIVLALHLLELIAKPQVTELKEVWKRA
jgi:hypothetical protein